MTMYIKASDYKHMYVSIKKKLPHTISNVTHKVTIALHRSGIHVVCSFSYTQCKCNIPSMVSKTKEKFIV